MSRRAIPISFEAMELGVTKQEYLRAKRRYVIVAEPERTDRHGRIHQYWAIRDRKTPKGEDDLITAGFETWDEADRYRRKLFYWDIEQAKRRSFLIGPHPDENKCDA